MLYCKDVVILGYMFLLSNIMAIRLGFTNNNTSFNLNASKFYFSSACR